ncbi:hypothetical protein LCGC14_0310090 [marine sediment metagenome]|uniref:Uncharacterized protein n=1 Tax=marine sediment metagenome TaxID=412755 RepID=A0A0F9TSQ3_9ZZZZ
MTMTIVKKDVESTYPLREIGDFNPLRNSV